MIDGNDERRPVSPALYLARRAVRHYGLFLAVLAATLLVTAVVVRYTDQVYRSETVILYRNGADNTSDSSRRVASRLQDMLMSHDRILRVMNELHLYPKVKNRDEAADEVRKKIVFRARDGATFLISYDAESPALAQAVAARLASSLIEDNTRLRVQEAQETRRFLAQEQARLSQEVKAREATLTAFLRAHPDALGRETGGGGEPAGMDELQREMDRLRGTPSSDGRPDADVIATVRRAEADYDVAQKDVTDKEQRLTDVHPDLIAARLRAKQAAANLQRLREAAGLNRPAVDGSGAQKDQVASIEREMARLRRSRPAGAPRVTRQQLEVSVMFESLRHDLEQTRARLAGLQDKQFQADLAAKVETSGELGQLAVLDPASRPGLPVVDVRKKVAIGGVVLALLLGAGAAAWRARRDDRIHDSADAEWLAGKPVLVLLPPPPTPGRRGRSAHG
jgi:succinoglycan biosynthesis transport protein ExoP